MTILQAISLLAPVMGADITCQKLLPVVINSSKDRWVTDNTPTKLISLKASLTHFQILRVPNIKFNVAKVLQSLVPILDQSVSSWFSSAFVQFCNIIQFSYGLLGNIMNTNFAGRWEDGETMPCRAERGPWCGRKILCKPGPSGMRPNHDVKLTSYCQVFRRCS
jgi:serine/threonine-protein phosphatase 2A regulatory subunit A